MIRKLNLGADKKRKVLGHKNIKKNDFSLSQRNIGVILKSRCKFSDLFSSTAPLSFQKAPESFFVNNHLTKVTPL